MAIHDAVVLMTSISTFGEAGTPDLRLMDAEVVPRRVPSATWWSLPLAARIYVAAVILGGAAVVVLWFPLTMPQPMLFALLATFACLTSAWKVTLPLPISNGATLSVSYAASLMSLLLLGPKHATLIAVAGVVTQCTYKPKQPYPAHRTVFSAATAALTMLATSSAFALLGGPGSDLDSFQLARPLVGTITTYFVVNTSLIASAIALSSRRTCLDIWREEFLWSGASFMVAGTAGALAAAVVHRGEHWKAALLMAPIYLTYRTYQLFAGRLDDQNRHTREIQRWHQETVAALGQAREAERALAGEKERLAIALAEKTRLEEARNHLLVREQAARASAEDANRLKDQFLAVVSHELRTPINAVMGWSDMLCKGGLQPALHDRAVQGIRHGARRQAQLIEDLLDISRITSGKLRLDRAFVDLRDTVRDAVEALQPSAEARGIHITVDAVAAVGEVYGDGARLQQIVVNLLSNAIKFTSDGGRIWITLRPVGTAIELLVADNGKGIAPDLLPSVFEAFRQGDGSTTRVHAGLGLGLSIVKTLVQAHGGTVAASSAGEHRGSTFTVSLPMAVSAEHRHTRAVVPMLPASTLPAQGALEGIAVLVVDDDEQSRDVVAAHLHESRAIVLTASSAARAIDVLQHEHVDVLLADIGMPHEDGYGLIRRVRALPPPHPASIPAAALTAFAREEDRAQALQAGFQLHLAKPVDAGTLISAVAGLAENTHSDRVRYVI